MALETATPNAALARVGVTGAAWWAPLGTTVPTGLEAWPDGFTDFGYISDDGLTESPDEDSQTFVAWQSNAPIRVEITRSVTTFKFTVWESNYGAVSAYYRAGRDDFSEDEENGVVTLTQRGKPGRDLRCYGFDVVDGVNHRRAICPMAEVTERGDVVYKSDTIIGYELTVTAYPGSDGVSVLRHFKEGWTLPAAVA